ncbi:sodium bile acid symporter family-domain-containing protein [Dunaliella salina]|uniref:Sodium bile acid symporter family-domain-containing protein n=1 Tax=Dunaliella salina TaxID=3046 RepID=A0ABQ7GXX3_DUNSA|nr:sodium bile acid symporter family-domain-containing protein [Dunaliella salina]|eukprot:KAF5839427.1 sodium bile acid symporter family-domain-containing protein [Dunaliella salina]
MQSLQPLPLRSSHVGTSSGSRSPSICINSRIAIGPLPCPSTANASSEDINSSNAAFSSVSRCSAAVPHLQHSHSTLRRGSSLVPRAEAGQVATNADDSPGPLLTAFTRFSSLVTSFFPLWVIGAAFGGFHKPELFNWFQTSQITNGLMFVQLGMGLTLTFTEIGKVFTKQPALLALGMFLQYTVLPAIGFCISREWGLERGLAIGVALVSCMPGGTASNIVAFIARCDMPLSVMMTSASTLMAIAATPLLSSILVGQLVPLDPKAMFLSVLQLVLAPVLIGATVNTLFPKFVSIVRPFMPMAATAIVVLIVGSMIACNVDIMSNFGPQVIPAVFTLHAMGFFLGYYVSKFFGTTDKVSRTNSIEVGMQSSALAAVLAKLHFPDQPMVVAACIMSACTHATLGSLMAGFWNCTVQDPDA